MSLYRAAARAFLHSHGGTACGSLHKPSLRIPRFLFQGRKYDLPARVPLIPPRESGAHKLLVQAPAVR